MNIESFAVTVDNLGFLAFLFVVIYSLIKLKVEKDVLTIILLVVGVLGAIIDGFIIFMHYFGK